jgi:acetoin utilization protein AcuB
MNADSTAGEPGAGHLVSDAMSRALVTVGPDEEMGEALHLAEATGSHHILVLDAGNLVGILCLCDLDDSDPAAAVSEYMSVPVLTIRADASLVEAADSMREYEVGCLPVVMGGLILGVLTEAELAGAGLPVLPRREGCRFHALGRAGRAP